MSHALRLAVVDPEAIDQLERRRCPRYRISGRATAILVDPAGGAAITEVALVDSSAGGLCVESLRPAEVGTELRLHFGGGPLAGRAGVVVRCEGSGDGVYEIAVDCRDRRMAA